MVGIATDYFKELFTSKPRRDCDHVLSVIQPFENLNEELTVEFQAKEIVEVVKSTTPLKTSDMRKAYDRVE
ncbi:hypothetical protein PVK06_040455 [Gossypium arboreum]|uniref:Uncharacterized protein n=1 Tax=Gossypium arboreum TaxID=29729 RepID=A0ABR0N5H2_GOSAR|nr:hypothetical protein PVK06_040455 [Gossypium arboreum]